MKVNDNILVFNSGSSSLKFQLFEVTAGEPGSILRGTARNFGAAATIEWNFRGMAERTTVSASEHGTAALQVLGMLERITKAGRSLLGSVVAVGHRLVHGGNSFTGPTQLTDRTLAGLDALSSLAPLHNPPALTVVQRCREHLPNIPMVGVFDTAFFHDLPDYARDYALPTEWTESSQEIRRYGFHGLAHRYMAERYLAIRGSESPHSKVITLQLGHGCSAAAVRDGHPLETSMGFTPLEGLIMATRPGDIDVGVVLNLLECGAVTVEELNEGLNHRAGLLGLSGVSADMQTLLKLERQGHEGARLAVQAFCHRARKYLGAYLAVLGGVDAVIFGGGIGENSADIRTRICCGMQWCGIELDARVNEKAVATEARITTSGSRVAAHVIPVNEEQLIARDTLRCLNAALT